MTFAAYICTFHAQFSFNHVTFDLLTSASDELSFMHPPNPTIIRSRVMDNSI